MKTLMEVIETISVSDFTFDLVRCFPCNNRTEEGRYPVFTDDEICIAAEKVQKHWINKIEKSSSLELIKIRFEKEFENIKGSYIWTGATNIVAPTESSEAFDDFKSLMILKMNEIKESYFSESSNTTQKEPIKINSDITVLLSLFEELSNIMFDKEKNYSYRISKLIEENFVSKEGKRIKWRYCYNKLTEFNGITDKTKKNLKQILEDIIKKLPD